MVRVEIEQTIAFIESIVNRINGMDKFQNDKEQLERYRMSMKRDQKEAELMLETEKAMWIMQRPGDSSVSDTRKKLRNLKERIDSLGFVETIVQAHYYKVMAGMMKLTAQFNDFYKNALLFLAYTPIEQIPLAQQQAYAFDIGIAALSGDRVYNFSELVCCCWLVLFFFSYFSHPQFFCMRTCGSFQLGHPVVESLRNSPAEWLYQLLFAFNRGNIAEYQQLMQKYSREIESQPVLQQRQAFLHEKIQLMCLMDLVFQKGATERVIEFDEIARVTGRLANQVEHLLLKALAFGLIRGTIDQVASTVHVVWVQPRVLDRSQVGSMREKLGAWLDKVNQTIDYLRIKGTEGAAEA